MNEMTITAQKLRGEKLKYSVAGFLTLKMQWYYVTR